MQKKLTTPPKKPTIDTLSKSLLEPSKLRFKLIQTHRSPHVEPSKPSDFTVVKTHRVLGLKRVENKREREKEEREKEEK